MVGGVVSTLITNLDNGIFEVLELFEELSKVSEMELKWGELLRVIDVFSLLEKAAWRLLNGHPIVPLNFGE